MLSGRIPADLRPNSLARARARHPPRFDLTAANPTRCSIPYPPDLLAPLGDAAGLVYEPHPRGHIAAREAIAAWYAGHGAAVHPDSVVLTSSTSEAYGLLFALLCDPGRTVAVPVPSYPLFEHLARVAGVTTCSYGLDPEGHWRVDTDQVREALSGGARALVAVHPNNPTGSWLHPSDATVMAHAAARNRAALIVDEVFLEYPLGEEAAPRSIAAQQDCLSFALGGLSKSVGLPQVKLGWIAVSGPPGDRRQALQGLEYLADTFLSVATPVQLALPHLLSAGKAVCRAIGHRCRVNLRQLHEAAARVPPVSVCSPQGGWNAVLRIPATDGEERLVLELLEKDRVAVHPGYFFDFPRDGYLVVSLLPPPEVFAAGIERILERIDRAARPG